MYCPHRKSKLLIATAAVTLAATSALAAQTPTTQPQDINSRIDALEAEIQQLRQQRADEKAQQQQQTTTQDVLKNAQHHSQLLDAQGVLAGYTNGRFILQSEDGKYLMHPWLQLQFRYVANYREGAKDHGAENDYQGGFEVRRLKFGVDGNLFGDQLNYFTQFAVDRHTGNLQLEMAWIKYQFDHSPFAVRAGQFKDPVDHEQLATSRLFPAIDRTFVDDVFLNGEGFIKGVSLIYDPGTFIRSEVAYTGGLRNFNTNFEQYPNTGIPADWGAAGRVEYKAFGKWKDYDQITAYGIPEDSLVFGGGADYTEAGGSAALLQVVDGQWQTRGGLSIYAAYLGRYTSNNPTAKGAYTYDPTARFQIAWAIDKHWEPYARYEYVHFDGKEFPKGTQTNVNILTVGGNYYVYGQSFKLSADVSYLPNGVPVNDDSFGLLVNNGRTEVVGRVQFQLLL